MQYKLIPIVIILLFSSPLLIRSMEVEEVQDKGVYNTNHAMQYIRSNLNTEPISAEQNKSTLSEVLYENYIKNSDYLCNKFINKVFPLKIVNKTESSSLGILLFEPLHYSTLILQLCDACNNTRPLTDVIKDTSNLANMRMLLQSDFIFNHMQNYFTVLSAPGIELIAKDQSIYFDLTEVLTNLKIESLDLDLKDSSNIPLLKKAKKWFVYFLLKSCMEINTKNTKDNVIIIISKEELQEKVIMGLNSLKDDEVQSFTKELSNRFEKDLPKVNKNVIKIYIDSNRLPRYLLDPNIFSELYNTQNTNTSPIITRFENCMLQIFDLFKKTSVHKPLENSSDKNEELSLNNSTTTVVIKDNVKQEKNRAIAMLGETSSSIRFIAYNMRESHGLEASKWGTYAVLTADITENCEFIVNKMLPLLIHKVCEYNIKNDPIRPHIEFLDVKSSSLEQLD